MMRLFFVVAVLVCPVIALAQPSRIERNVARSKATLSEVLAETAWKDGETVTTQGNASAGDSGGQQWIYHKTGWSGLSTGQQAASGFFQRVGVTDAYLESVDKTVIHWARWGLVADGVTDDHDTLTAMIEATQLGYGTDVILPHSKSIAIGSDITKADFTVSFKIHGNGSTIVASSKVFDFATTGSSLTIAGDVDYKTSAVSVADASGVNAGDILYLGSDIQFDTGWGYTCHDTRRVKSISGNTINCVSTTNLSYATATDTITVRSYPECYVEFLDLDFQVSASHPAVAVRFMGGKVENCKFKGNTGSGSTGLQIYGGVNFEINRCTFDTWVYGALVNYSRHVRFADIVARNCSTHPISIATASSNIEVEGLVASMTTGAAVESHPAFYITFKDVFADGGGMNCRAFGIHLENIVIKNPAVSDVDLTPISSQTNVARFAHLATDYSVVMRSVEYLPDTSAASVYVGTRITQRRWTIDDCQLPGIIVGKSGGFQQLTDGLFVTKTRTAFISPFVANTPIYATDCVLDKTLLPLISSPLQVYASATAPLKYTNLRFINWDTSDTVAGLFNCQDLTFTNCTFGTFADFCTSKSGSGTSSDWKFVNCDLIFTSDASAGFDLNTFSNCSGSVGGVSITSRGGLIDEDSFATNSASLAASQQSVKAYVDADVGYAQISIEDNATATTVASTQSDWSAKSQFVGFGTNFSESSNATPDHTNDHITLTSAGTWEVSCVVTLNGTVVSDLWELALWKNNGATQVSTKQGVNIRGAGLTYEKQVTISGLVDASASDTIELWAQRTNGTGSITITNAVMTAKKVSD